MKRYSVAIFGSSARRDHDKYSDKDILIVADDYATLQDVKSNYSSENWSVSAYTFGKLEYLAKTKSLFVKHLQLEAIISYDFNNKLKNILHHYTERDSYETELLDAKKYFEIIKSIPNTPLGLGWMCDCFYVGLRNFLIFRNAGRKQYEFSYVKLITALCEEASLDKNDFKVLKELRVIKRNYRDGVTDEFPSTEYVESLIKIARTLELVSIELVPPQQFVEHVIKGIRDCNLNAYQRLRLVEGLLSSTNLVDDQIKKMVTNPQLYTSKFKNDKFVDNLVSKIYLSSIKPVAVEINPIKIIS